MTVYTDGTHVVSDRGLNELHSWAKQAGVKHAHYQAHPRHPHYDLPKYMRGQRLVNAATVSSRDLVRVLRGQKFDAAEVAGGEATITAPKHLRGCGFCGEPFTDERPRRGYVYPVVGDDGRTVGKQACAVCYPVQFATSVKAGLIIPLDPNRARLV